MSGNELERMPLSVRVAGGVMVGLLAVSGCTQSSEQPSEAQIDYAPSVTRVPTTVEAFTGPYPVTAPFNIESDNCIEPSKEDIDAVNELLVNPGDPELKETLIGMGKGGGGKGAAPEADAAVDKYQDRLDTLAKEHHRTIIDGQAEIELLSNDYGIREGGKEPSPFSYYLSTVQEFTGKFGVTVSVGTPDQTYAYNGRAPEPEILEGENAKQTMMSIISAYSGKSEEYVKGLAGLQHIVLITGTEADAAAYAEVADGKGTFYINIDPREEAYALDVSGILHETYHLYDSKACGPSGMFKDPTFDSLNGGLNIYSDPKAGDLVFPYVSYNQYGFDSGPRNEYMYKAKQDGDMAGYCAASQLDDEQAAQVMAISDKYPNPAEDKADIGSIMGQSYRYGEFINPRFKVMTAKLRFLLARMYHQDPDEVEYLIAQAEASYQDPAKTVC
ncbi:MAG: hypothetical protein ABIQ89_00300 [Candidatus Saccharimonadales bacterium]